MRPKGKGAELERIRYKAVKAVLAGTPQVTVAHVMSIHHKVLSRWVTAFRRDPEALKAKPNMGRPPRLSSDDLNRLVEILKKGPRSFGWETDIWTTGRVTKVIEQEFGKKFHRDHVFKILTQKLGWSWQKPGKRAREQDPIAVMRWLESEWPEIKKKPRRKMPLSHSSTRAVS